MPIEIRELLIKAVVDESNAALNSAGAPAEPDREELIAECVEQVLQTLREERER